MCVCVCGEKGEVRLVVRGGEGLGGRKETGEWETGGCVETCVRCLRAVFGCVCGASETERWSGVARGSSAEGVYDVRQY